MNYLNKLNDPEENGISGSRGEKLEEFFIFSHSNHLISKPPQ
jgi:hypothetical protein